MGHAGMTITILLLALGVALVVSYALWLVGQFGARRRRMIHPKDDFVGRRLGG